MTTLRFRSIRIAASHLGAENPLPDLRIPQPPRDQGPIDPARLTPQRRYSLASHMAGCLPYRLQDVYDRSEAPRPLKAAVLENAAFRATFLLELGGRLWSLLHKPTGRELLHQPDVLHLVNIALRNAWFCGGVEWNIAVRGHTSHTCSPVYAARLADGAGGEALRLHEWDRFRQLVWQIDFLLRDDVPALLARMRVINTLDETVPMYWWSNAAVEEAAGHRVLAPATAALQHDYEGTIQRRPVPIQDGVDVSYPRNSPAAHDFFYDIPEGNRPWVTSLDGAGRGLIIASTRRLRGRKLFVWGMGRGGRRWQEHLGGRDGRGYVEIQAGLAATQADYIAMPPRAEWTWLEAYGLMEADPAVAHGPDWPAACAHVQHRLDALLPQDRLESLLTETGDLAGRPPRKFLSRGSTWGTLEVARRRAAGRAVELPPGIRLPRRVDEPFLPWLGLANGGELAYSPPDRAPGEYVTGLAWRKLLSDAVAAGRGDHWLSWLHLGVMAFREGDLAAAEQAWRTSLQREPSAWAYRNLAVLARQAERPGETAELYLKAAALQPAIVPLAAECGRALLDAGRLDELAAWMDSLPEDVRRAGRLRVLAAWAACHRGRLDEAEHLLEGVELTDVREGETQLTDLWFEVQSRRAAAAEGVPLDDTLRQRIRETLEPPAHLDYRMH